MRMSNRSRSGFSLIEMLVVMGIIAVLLAASLGGYSALTKSADRAKVQELVKNVEVALTECYNREGAWPKRLVKGMQKGLLDGEAALPLARGGYLSLSTDSPDDPKNATKLTGWDRFGVVTPWATAAIKKAGNAASADQVPVGRSSAETHTVRYALDLDGDGITEIKDLGDVKVRATACVWCCNKEGVIGTVNTATRGKGGVFSFTTAQIVQ